MPDPTLPVGTVVRLIDTRLARVEQRIAVWLTPLVPDHDERAALAARGARWVLEEEIESHG